MRNLRVSIRPAIAAAAIVALLAPSAALANRDALAAITIDNFGRISDAYYRGSQPQGDDYARLKTLGVKTVIDLQKDFATQNYARTEEADVKAAGMNFIRIPMTTRTPPTAAQIAQFLEIVNNPDNQPVYVHCKGGKHRTGVMTAIYRMVNDKWTSDQAYDEMKKFDFGPSLFHPEFKEFVYDYEEELTARSAVAVTGTR